MGSKYRALNDSVVVKKVRKAPTEAGIVSPEKSSSGWDYFVLSVGPGAEGKVKVGEEVLFIGSNGQEFVTIPWDPDIMIHKMSNLLCVVEK